MDAIQTDLEKEYNIDNRYEKMLDGNQHHQLWIDYPDGEQDESLISAERYARALKSKENE